jgi:hypothetical protein
MGILGLFSDENDSNSTTSNNTSNTYASSDSHDLAINTSSNSTSNSTNTLTQDRRLVVDNGGYGVSADNSSIFTANSNNSTTINTSTDYGAIAAAGQLGVTSIAANTALAAKTVDASRYLIGSTADIFSAGLAYAEHLTEGTNAEARNAIREVVAASGNAINQVATVAAKPLDANDPQRLVIIVGLAVVGLVFFSKIK